MIVGNKNTAEKKKKVATSSHLFLLGLWVNDIILKPTRKEKIGISRIHNWKPIPG